MRHNKNYRLISGFSLIEILVAMGIIAVLASIVLIAINPARQFAQARNTQRTSNITAILNAIGQRAADNRGVFETNCTAGAIPTIPTNMAKSGYDIAPCIVPLYMSSLPFDPGGAGTHYLSETDYNTGYIVSRDSITGRITVTAPSAELDVVISSTR